VTNCIVDAYTGEVGVITLKCRILDDNVAEITIKDRGCGIEDVDKARQPLYTTGGEERAGMGFSIMESFTDEMRVRSRPGRGTTVVLRKRIGGRNEQ
jgi:stage II sporulation protein AB (anti-sigma F factor)